MRDILTATTAEGQPTENAAADNEHYDAAAQLITRHDIALCHCLRILGMAIGTARRHAERVVLTSRELPALKRILLVLKDRLNCCIVKGSFLEESLLGLKLRIAQVIVVSSVRAAKLLWQHILLLLVGRGHGSVARSCRERFNIAFTLFIYALHLEVDLVETQLLLIIIFHLFVKNVV